MFAHAYFDSLFSKPQDITLRQKTLSSNVEKLTLLLGTSLLLRSVNKNVDHVITLWLPRCELSELALVYVDANRHTCQPKKRAYFPEVALRSRFESHKRRFSRLAGSKITYDREIPVIPCLQPALSECLRGCLPSRTPPRPAPLHFPPAP